MDQQQIKLLRFADLKAAGAVKHWAQVRRMVDNYGFPPGFMLSPGIRVWDAHEVDAWLEKRRSAARDALRRLTPEAAERRLDVEAA